MATPRYTQAELERTLAEREIGAIERSEIYGTDQLDELAAEQDECERFKVSA